MQQAPQVSQEAQILRAVGDWAVAYTVAVLAGSTVFYFLSGAWFGVMFPFWMIPVVASSMGLFGLPGFIVLRVGLHMAQVGSILGFAVAGAVNAATFLAFFSAPRGVGAPDEQDATMVILCVAGAVAGAVYRLVERKIVSKKAFLA